MPESPFWLLSSKNQPDDDAQKSLQWLRGWVSPQAIEQELNDLKRHIAISKTCETCQQNHLADCNHKQSTVLQRTKEIFTQKTGRPLLLVVLSFSITGSACFVAVQPYLVQILNAFGVPIDLNWGSVIVSVSYISGALACLCLIKFIGKRNIFLAGIVGTFFCSICLGNGVKGNKN